MVDRPVLSLPLSLLSLLCFSLHLLVQAGHVLPSPTSLRINEIQNVQQTMISLQDPTQWCLGGVPGPTMTDRPGAGSNNQTSCRLPGNNRDSWPNTAHGWAICLPSKLKHPQNNLAGELTSQGPEKQAVTIASIMRLLCCCAVIGPHPEGQSQHIKPSTT